MGSRSWYRESSTPSGKRKTAWCWWIIKTDHVKEGQELIDRYQRQMHYYSQALERAYGKKVKECYLYSFALGKAVAVEV